MLNVMQLVGRPGSGKTSITETLEKLSFGIDGIVVFKETADKLLESQTLFSYIDLEFYKQGKTKVLKPGESPYTAEWFRNQHVIVIADECRTTLQSEKLTLSFLSTHKKELNTIFRSVTLIMLVDEYRKTFGDYLPKLQG